ncbi:MAG: diguanylate cyclase [Gallionella sp.]|nr:diguanylate cyclase [Gallionella sp.]
MRLGTKFLLVISAIFLGFAALTWYVIQDAVHEINREWGKNFSQRQVLFDKHRTLMPLIREIDLARKMASDPAIVEMALHEGDVKIRQRALEVMEDYRYNFRDHSYFAAFTGSGNYYFNDTAGRYTGKELRYKLSPNNPNDKWFYATLKENKNYQVNLDPDVHLGVTKIWINVLLKRGDEVLGVIGTGLDLTEFLKESVGIVQPGIYNFFIDRSMAIQLSPDPNLIDYASITKDVRMRIKADVLFENKEDVENLRLAMQQLATRQEQNALLEVTFKGEKYWLGIAYLPEIDWFDLTLMDSNKLKLLHGFGWISLFFTTLFLLVMLLLGILLHRWILKPIYKIKIASDEIQRGNFETERQIVGTGEIAALSRSFWQMVEFVHQTNDKLERKVKERTEDLHRLTEIDPLTGLLNRRGMLCRFEEEIARQARQGGSLGLLLLDLDHFKQINDTHGHAAGDLALCATANMLHSMKRSYDHAGRWGGEEFLILLPECSEQDLLAIAERIRETVQTLHIETGVHSFSFTTSIGVHHSASPQTLDAMLHQVDMALYAAKDAGRNCVRLAEQAKQPEHSPSLV